MSAGRDQKELTSMSGFSPNAELGLEPGVRTSSAAATFAQLACGDFWEPFFPANSCGRGRPHSALKPTLVFGCAVSFTITPFVFVNEAEHVQVNITDRPAPALLKAAGRVVIQSQGLSR